MAPVGRHDVGGVAGEEQVAVAHRLGDEAAQGSDRLLDRRPGHDLRRHLIGVAGEQLLPEPRVGPVVDGVVERALHVVAAEHRVALRREREAAWAVAVHDVLERRRLRHDPEPAERVRLLVGPQHRRRDRRLGRAVEAVAADDELAVDPLLLARRV